ncbi:MAG: transcription elongation factor GreA [SAR202 cluster bacterium]|nr:transcription elongation factor GreA [SAR202 cluster bacterium]
MAKRETYLTLEGKQNLEQELENLKSVRRREVAERIRTAHEGGGNVDNAEYEDAKNEQAFVEGRIADLEEILSNAVVVASEDGGGNVVKFGSSVVVSGQDGSKRTYTLVGSAEAVPLEGKISLDSPVGQALLGRKVGDTVEVRTPKGVNKLKITKVE